jgi:hypothetical protein
MMVTSGAIHMGINVLVLAYPSKPISHLGGFATMRAWLKSHRREL